MRSDLTTADILGARRTIAGLALRTPLVRADALSERLKSEVLLKLETLQPTGAFKVRGAANALLKLSTDQRRRGVVCASTGNHGRAVAWVAQKLGIPATVRAWFSSSSTAPRPRFARPPETAAPNIPRVITL